MAAPVCHVNPSQEITQPALKLLSSIGTPRDLPSALKAISQLTQVINIMLGAITIRSGDVVNITPQNTNTSGQGGTNFTTRPSKKPPGEQEQEGRYFEVRTGRVMEKVRIEQEDNPENWVEFERINRIVYQDNVTGEQWEWRRK